MRKVIPLLMLSVLTSGCLTLTPENLDMIKELSKSEKVQEKFRTKQVKKQDKNQDVVKRKASRVKFPSPAKDWSVSVETHGVKLQTQPNLDGKAEYIIAAVNGPGWRAYLMNMQSPGGHKRWIRFMVQEDDHVYRGVGQNKFNGFRLRIDPDTLMGWHTWTMQCKDGRISLLLDGVEVDFHNDMRKPATQVWFGGNGTKTRNFNTRGGTWKNGTVDIL